MTRERQGAGRLKPTLRNELVVQDTSLLAFPGTAGASPAPEWEFFPGSAGSRGLGGPLAASYASETPSVSLFVRCRHGSMDLLAPCEHPGVEILHAIGHHCGQVGLFPHIASFVIELNFTGFEELHEFPVARTDDADGGG